MKQETKNKKLEEEFNKQVENYITATKECYAIINEQLKIARDAIKVIEKTSEKYGIPVECDVTPISMSYLPKSGKKWQKLSTVIDEIYDNNYDGISQGFNDPKFGKLIDNAEKEISKFRKYWDFESFDYQVDNIKNNAGWEHSAVCW